MKLIHVVQHTSAEYLGLIEDHLEGRGVRFRYHRPFTSKGSLPETSPLALYMRDWPLPPAGARVLARDSRERAALWQGGRHAFGFAGHPGLKVAMVEDLIMEFEESPPEIDAGLARLRSAQRAIEDALVPIMTGLIQMTGWMDDRSLARDSP